MKDVDIDTRVWTVTAPVGCLAYATTKFGLAFLRIYEVGVEKPKDGGVIVADASCSVSMRVIEAFHELDRD